ncbi:MAG: small multi-drug export protein [Candidatus Paceibacterota bacterium]|jgi:uncharacterized membrane protein
MKLILTWLNFLPPEILTLIVAATPISELRGAIPLALGVFNFTPIKSFLLAWLGNLIPVFLLLWWLDPVADFLGTRFSLAKKFFDWLFARTRQKFLTRYEALGELALIIFVAIPFPLTGAWTGSVASFLFGVPPKRALWLIAFGVAISGVIMIFLSSGVIKIF